MVVEEVIADAATALSGSSFYYAAAMETTVYSAEAIVDAIIIPAYGSSSCYSAAADADVDAK